MIAADHLTRTFGARIAVDDLSLEVGDGEIVALLGPNGAGKTTTMRMLAGLIAPSSGRVTIDHHEVNAISAGAARGNIGWLAEAPGLWERLSVRLNLLTHARLQGVSQPHARVDAVLKRLNLADRARDIAGTLSKGLKQRVAVARALLHEPRVLLLDEPTSGLDPASARHIRDLIASLRGEGRAVLVSTHNLAEAEQLSDRIAVLKTRLLACDTPAALRSSTGPSTVTIEFAGGEPPEAISIMSIGEVPAVVARLVGEGRRIVRVTPEQRSLEESYLDLVGERR